MSNRFSGTIRDYTTLDDICDVLKSIRRLSRAMYLIDQPEEERMESILKIAGLILELHNEILTVHRDIIEKANDQVDNEIPF